MPSVCVIRNYQISNFIFKILSQGRVRPPRAPPAGTRRSSSPTARQDFPPRREEQREDSRKARAYVFEVRERNGDEVGNNDSQRGRIFGLK